MERRPVLIAPLDVSIFRGLYLTAAHNLLASDLLREATLSRIGANRRTTGSST